MIKKINLVNFKIHKDSEVIFEEMLSILTGENNGGKTSLLESMLIFQECYNNTLHKIARSTSTKVKTNILNIGHFDFQPKFVSGFNSVRSENYYELFYKNSSEFTIQVTFEIERQNITIGFTVAKGRNETAYNITPQIDDISLKNLNMFDPENFMVFIKSSPISTIVRNEPYFSPKMLEKYIFESSNLSIMRNRLLKIKNEHKLLDLQSQIEYILGFEKFELDVDYNMNKDLYIKANFKTKSMDEYQDIAMLGSGTLQIIEVLISLNLEDKYKLRIALLDEPDSHLHRKLQGQLINKLREISKNGIQIILTTHNEQIVSNANLSEILHLYIPSSSTKMIAKPIAKGYQTGRTIGFLQNTSKKNLYSSLGISNTAMNILEAIESDKVVLVEGYSDAIYLEAIGNRRAQIFPVSSKNKVAFWSINGIDDLPNKLKYWKSILETISNETNIWTKSILLLDSDSLSNSEMMELSKEIKKHYDIDTLFWNCYTIETILLEKIEGFAVTFANLFELDKQLVLEEVNLYLQNINIENFKTKIHGQRQSREKSFEIFNNQNLKLNDGNIYNNYMQHIQSSHNKAVYLFGKDEVNGLIKHLITHFAIHTEQQPQDVLIQMFLNYDSASWQTSWTDILKKIYG